MISISWCAPRRFCWVTTKAHAVSARRLLALAPLQIAQALIGLWRDRRVHAADEPGRVRPLRAGALGLDAGAHAVVHLGGSGGVPLLRRRARGKALGRPLRDPAGARASALGRAFSSSPPPCFGFVGFSDDIAALSAFAAAPPSSASSPASPAKAIAPRSTSAATPRLKPLISCSASPPASRFLLRF